MSKLNPSETYAHVGMCKHVVTMVTAAINSFGHTGHNAYCALPCTLKVTKGTGVPDAVCFTV